MLPFWLGLGGVVVIVAGSVGLATMARPARARAAVLEDVRRKLRGGRIERHPGRGKQARGRLGDLEVTVDLYSDPSRPRQSPMWRVVAIGPVALSSPIEARVGGWDGWIDPWLQLGETLVVPAALGPAFTLHAERMPATDHTVVTVLRRQGERLGPGALHARPDLMRAETRFSIRVDENRALFAYLRAMAEISEEPRTRQPRATFERRPVPRYEVPGGR